MRIIDQGSISVVVSNEEYNLYFWIKKKGIWPKKSDVAIKERTQLLVKQLMIKGLIKRYRHDDFTYYKIVEKKNA
jgi:hypothetical protein